MIYLGNLLNPSLLRASSRLLPEEWVSAWPRRERELGGEQRVVHQLPPLLPCLRVQAKEGQCHKVSPHFIYTG